MGFREWRTAKWSTAQLSLALSACNKRLSIGFDMVCIIGCNQGEWSKRNSQIKALSCMLNDIETLYGL